MKYMNLSIALCIILLACFTRATVFEADTSETVDFFIQESEKETMALLFYDGRTENQENEDKFSRLASIVLGIFMSQDQEGRSTEEWVEFLDDKLHLMRIDVSKPELRRSVEEFNIEDVPYIVLQDKQRTILREKIDEETFDHLRQLLDRRQNMQDKTGGAVLKSFNLEQDDDQAPQAEPKVLQFFDLEKDEPTNIEAPLETQQENWGGVDVIGPEGGFIQRGRDWIAPYQIPQSGIKSQEDRSKVRVQERTRDDPRYQRRASTPSSTRATAGTPTSATQPPQPSARKPSVLPASSSKPAQTTTTKPSTSGGVQKALSGQTQPRTQASTQASTRTAVKGSSQPSGQTRTQTSGQFSTQGLPAQASKTSTARPYHSHQYKGYGEIDQRYKDIERSAEATERAERIERAERPRYAYGGYGGYPRRAY